MSALLHVTHIWLPNLEYGQEIGAVFFDFRKDFDTIPHQPLISKLERIGFGSVYHNLDPKLPSREISESGA